MDSGDDGREHFISRAARRHGTRPIKPEVTGQAERQSEDATRPFQDGISEADRIIS